MYDRERRPLSQHENTVFDNPTGSECMPGQASTLRPNVLPPPTVASQRRVGVKCRLCEAIIVISDKGDEYLVKCEQCNEATPIRNAPPGQKYVRCPCKCLLVCKSSSQRIACPRPNCKRILTLARTPEPTMPVTPPEPTIPGMSRVTCGHCHYTYLVLAMCPHCGEVSSVSSDIPRGRKIMFLMIGFVFLAIGIGAMVKRGKK